MTVLAVFVGGFGTESVDVGGQSVEAVVLPSPQPSPTGEEVDVGMEKVYPTLL